MQGKLNFVAKSMYHKQEQWRHFDPTAFQVFDDAEDFVGSQIRCEPCQQEWPYASRVGQEHIQSTNQEDIEAICGIFRDAALKHNKREITCAVGF